MPLSSEQIELIDKLIAELHNTQSSIFMLKAELDADLEDVDDEHKESVEETMNYLEDAESEIDNIVNLLNSAKQRSYIHNLISKLAPVSHYAQRFRC